MKFGAHLHRAPLLSLALLLALTAFFATRVVPLQYDFSFTALFVGEGDDYDRLRNYLNRFGNDVHFVVISVESDALYSTPVMSEIAALTADLEAVEGVSEVVSPTTAVDLRGDGGSLGTERIVPNPFPQSADDWAQVRSAAIAHPLLAPTVFSHDGRHAAIVVRFGRESGEAACSDGVDNDGDGATDCQDNACKSAAAGGVCDPASHEGDNTTCSNGRDDDGNGAVDCADPACADVRVCDWASGIEAGRAVCRDGVDNDGDGAVDCADRGCLTNPDVPFCSSPRAVTALAEAFEARAEAEGWGSVAIGGIPIVSDAYTDVIQHDMSTYLPLTAGIVGFVLILLFRSGRGTVLPLIIVGLGVLWALGALMGTGGKLNMISSSMPTLLLVIAVADSVHILSRYLEESAEGGTSAEVTARTMAQMAPACLLTSVTSAVGFGSLLSAHLPVIRSFGLYTGVAILLSYVVTMLLLPPVLARLPVPDARARARARLGEALARRVTHAFVVLLQRHRRWAVGGTLAVCVVCAIGISRVDTDSHLMQDLRPSNPVAIDNAALEAHHGGVLSGAIMFEGPPGAFASPDALRALDAIAETAETWRWEGEQLVSETLTLADLVAEANAAYRGDEAARNVPATTAAVTALLDQVPVDQREALVSADYGTTHVTFRMYAIGSNAWQELRAELTATVEAHSDALPGDWYFTGSSTLGQDAMRFMTRDLLTSLLIAIAIIMVLMSVLFRSVRIGVLSLVPNGFPLMVTLAFVGFAGIDVRVSTAVVFSISLGIAVDDTIHVLVRFLEEKRRPGAEFEEALYRAIDGAGRGVVFTTVLLCVGFGTLTLSEFTAVRELGLLGGVTLLAALIGDLVVLPLVLLAVRPKSGSETRSTGFS